MRVSPFATIGGTHAPGLAVGTWVCPRFGLSVFDAEFSDGAAALVDMCVCLREGLLWMFRSSTPQSCTTLHGASRLWPLVLFRPLHFLRAKGSEHMDRAPEHVSRKHIGKVTNKQSLVR